MLARVTYWFFSWNASTSDFEKLTFQLWKKKIIKKIIIKFQHFGLWGWRRRQPRLRQPHHDRLHPLPGTAFRYVRSSNPDFLLLLTLLMSLFGLGFVVVQLVNAHALYQCVLLLFFGIFNFWFRALWRTAFTAAVRGLRVLDPAASEVNIRGELPVR